MNVLIEWSSLASTVVMTLFWGVVIIGVAYAVAALAHRRPGGHRHA